MLNISKSEPDYYVGIKLNFSLQTVLSTNDLVVTGVAGDELLIGIKSMFYQATGYPSVIKVLYIPIA